MPESNMTEPGSVDFFVSYAEPDQDWAEWIAWQLEEAGYSTLVQAWDICPGDGFIREVDRALRTAARTLAVLSRAYLGSPYAAMEWHESLRGDKNGQRRALVLARVEDVRPPGLLGQLVCIDLFDAGARRARDLLLAGIRTGRAKPPRGPAFPGGPGRPAPAFPSAAGPGSTATKTATATATAEPPRSGPGAPRSVPARHPPHPTARHVHDIVAALHALDVVASAASRDAVVRELPFEITSRLAPQADRLDVYLAGLVRACFAYPGGMASLLEALEFYEHDTVSMGDLLDVVDRVSAELGASPGGEVHPTGDSALPPPGADDGGPRTRR
jgi:hypothetical protein